MHYDYLIVGAGLFGAIFAYEVGKKGKTSIVIDKRDHIAGNIYTREIDDINVHEYGAHIFHTSNKEIWNYINQFAEFNHYINSPVAIYKDELYNLPFNMNTFSKMWNIRTPDEAKNKINQQIKALGIEEPKNLEEQALKLVGSDIYEKLVKGYTEKQWGRSCTELPSFIIKRLPVRFTYDNNYFNDPYQGIPKGGYTKIVKKLLEKTKVILEKDFKFYIDMHQRVTKDGDTFDTVIYTGAIDEYYKYQLGALEYRSVRFETMLIPDCENFQGNAVVNYTEQSIPYTRIIEHKHFEFGQGNSTVISKEFPAEWKLGDEPYYPINDNKNTKLYQNYCELAEEEANVLFGGRLGQYQYFDMDKTIESALKMVRSLE